MNAPSRTMSASDWLLLVVLSVLWGGSFLFNSVVTRELPALTGAAGRVVLGALVLLSVARALGASLPRERAVWIALAIMGLLNNVLPFTLMLWGQKHITSGLAAILIATTPLFAVVVAHFVTDDEKLTPARVTGFFAGLAGVVIVIGPDLLRDLGHDVLAQGALLLSALLYAVSGIYGRRFHGMPPAVTAAGQMTMASAMLIPLALAIDQPWTLPPLSLAAVGALLGLGVLSSGVAFLIFFRILRRAGATNLLLVNFLIPVSAILFGVTLLGERLAPRHLIGMAVIGLGLLAIDGRAGRWLAARMAAPARR